VANSAPARSFPGVLVVLYAAWCSQVLGNAIFGGYVSAFVGAMVMTPVAYWVSRFPSAMPQHASSKPTSAKPLVPTATVDRVTRVESDLGWRFQ
jgi:uncharacterized membrane protein YjjB (DUF3815 family)